MRDNNFMFSLFSGKPCEYDVQTVDLTNMDKIASIGYDKQFEVNGKIILRKRF